MHIADARACHHRPFYISGRLAALAWLTVAGTALAATPTYPDCDGDAFGAHNPGSSCIQVHNNLDCDDTRASTYPGAREIALDGRDNDCDGDVDEYNGAGALIFDDDRYRTGAVASPTCSPLNDCPEDPIVDFDDGTCYRRHEVNYEAGVQLEVEGCTYSDSDHWTSTRVYDLKSGRYSENLIDRLGDGPGAWFADTAIYAADGSIEDYEDLSDVYNGARTSIRPAGLRDSGSSEQQQLPGRFNADGRVDVVQTWRGWSDLPVCASTGEGWSCASWSATIWNAKSTEQRFLTGDFNADGLTDVFQVWRGWASIPACVSTGSGFKCNAYTSASLDSGSPEQRFLTGDFNADGRTDILQTWRGWPKIPVCTSTGAGWKCSSPAAAVEDAGSSEQRFLTGDINGDGRTDVIQAYRGWQRLPVCTSTGTGWKCSSLAATVYDSGSGSSFLAADFDGDGLTDVLQPRPELQAIPVCRAGADRWTCTKLPAMLVRSSTPDQRFLTADLNGDGRADVVQTSRTWDAYHVCLSTGTGWNCVPVPTETPDSESTEQEFLSGDVDADGHTDLFQVYRKWTSIPTHDRFVFE